MTSSNLRCSGCHSIQRGPSVLELRVRLKPNAPGHCCTKQDPLVASVTLTAATERKGFSWPSSCLRDGHRNAASGEREPLPRHVTFDTVLALG